jgi:glyoxylase-like metal-dependent hydrolase (beta-lactamase superfamily II)
MSIAVRSFYHTPTQTWSHVVSDAVTRAAAIVDPVLDFEPASGRVSSEFAQTLLDYVRAQELHVLWLLETHVHADHLSAADWLKRALGDPVQTGIGQGIVEVQRQFRAVFGLEAELACDGREFDRRFADGESLPLGRSRITVLATPGHTCDGVSYHIEDAVFVGDTLFAPAAGTARCDFPGGDAATLYRSIQRLYRLPDATRVFLCHDYPASGATPIAETTIGAEKAGNVHLNATTREADYVALRRRRDATLATPRLLYPSLQVNIFAGRLPAADAAGRVFLRLPIRDERETIGASAR